MARKKLYYPPGDLSVHESVGNIFLENGIEYFGKYHKYKSTGEMYTETFYIDGISVELFTARNSNNLSDNVLLEYNKLTKNFFKKNFKGYPIHYIPFPTKDDYDRGYIDRYVAFQSNYPINIAEISQKNYNELTNPFYLKKQFTWKIGRFKYVSKESIIEANQKVVKSLKPVVPKIGFVLRNLIQFSY